MVDIHGARFRPGDPGGHYESYFLRANHPTRPLAFWIRYTVFSPRGQGTGTIGELWAVVGDAERGRHVAVKKEMPISECTFSRDGLRARIGEALLEPGKASGAAALGRHQIGWRLRFEGTEPPVLLLPKGLYGAGLPKAKSLVGLPMARFSGAINVDGEGIDVDGWVGSQNHNWGSKHTDRYAYGQVCGFDNAPDSFLEMATARVRIGPFWTPAMTPIVLRHAGREHALNGVWQSIRAQASYEYFTWKFSSTGGGVGIEGEISGKREEFVGLRYYNPPGGTKTCLNSKLARCRLVLTGRGERTELVTRHRAAFEILTDDDQHGVAIQA